MEVNKIYCGDSLSVLKILPDESVNCCVTSPPYWNLRDYSAEGQLGLEKTFEEYITKLCNIFDEVKRVLRKDGTCWVNLGDSYNSHTFGNSKKGGGLQKNLVQKNEAFPRWRKAPKNLGDKSQCAIPERFLIEMLNRGWIKRNTIIWHKPNCMPSSAKDRFTVDFEYVYFFVKNSKAIFWTNSKTGNCVRKQPLGTKGIEGIDWEWKEIGNNYSDCDTKINEGIAESLNSPRARKYREKKLKKVSLWTGHDYWFEQQFEEHTIGKEEFLKKCKVSSERKKDPSGKFDNHYQFNQYYTKNEPYFNEQGRNKRAVWTITTKPFPEAHFAVYPEALIEPMIQAGCPRYVCKKCGKARVKIIDNTERVNTRPGLDTGNMKSGKDIDPNKELHNSDISKYRQQIKYKELGYTDCGCNAGFEGGVVLDPFIGAGTTAVVAKKQGKRYLGIEIKQEYIDMANKRIRVIPELLF